MRPHTMPRASLAVCFAAAILTTSCQTVYYETMEKFGVHKRDILVDRVQDARDAQEAAKQQFASALAEFSSIVKVQSGELAAKYETLDKEYRRSESRATAVRDRINEVERVSKALFKEWEAELDEYHSAELRRVSERKLQTTRGRYQQLIGAMRRAEASIDPVLGAFRDQVLFLKHNLNAQAVASLQGELVSVQSNVAALIREMERSISEADTFIRQLGNE